MNENKSIFNEGDEVIFTKYPSEEEWEYIGYVREIGEFIIGKKYIVKREYITKEGISSLGIKNLDFGSTFSYPSCCFVKSEEHISFNWRDWLYDKIITEKCNIYLESIEEFNIYKQLIKFLINKGVYELSDSDFDKVEKSKYTFIRCVIRDGRKLTDDDAVSFYHCDFYKENKTDKDITMKEIIEKVKKFNELNKIIK